MVFQGHALFPHLSVKENIAYPLRRRRLDRTTIDRRVSAVLEKVQLSHLADRHPKQLSGGQQQRVALARSIVFDPDLILLDEPLSALDANLRHDLQEELKALHRESGTTFVCVTHDQDEALSMSDRIAVMRDGRIVQLATPQHLYKQPASRFVANFMGAKNLLTMTVDGVRDGVARCSAQGRSLLQALGSGAAQAGASITVAIRPSSIALGEKAGANRVKGRVVSFSYRGSEVVVTLASEIGILTLRRPADDADAPLAIGEEVIASWHPDAAVIVADTP
jgi:putative spermidine/putrescine transport system ATP-binding protein